MKSRIYITLFLSNILLLLAQPMNSCGYYESEADFRAMMFRATLPGMRSMGPFNYTMSSVYYRLTYDGLNTDINENDRYRNCSEWLAICDKSVVLEDIYTTQYNTDGRLFMKAFRNNAWEENFFGNTFIQFLLKKENKDLLDYMIFAKNMELTEVGGNSRFEEWDSPSTYGQYYYRSESHENIGDDARSKIKKELLRTAWKDLNAASSRFLQQRYAFQVCRLLYQVGQLPGIDPLDVVYNKYFGKVDPNNLMSIWAGLFRAMWTSVDENDRYRYFIQVFSNSDEKKFRCVQLFTDGYNPESLTNPEQSVAIVMESVKNPGRALEQICKAYSLDKQNKFIPFLILREINKLEDWLITPLFYDKFSYSNSDPFHCAYYDSWMEEYKREHPEDVQEEQEDETTKQLQAENLLTDQQYMDQLKSLLIQVLSESKGETKDFYAISLAHISLLQENAIEAKKYLSMVSDKANPTIQLQKKLETIWIAIKTQDIESDAFQSVFLKNITDMEKVSTPDYENKQMLYTLISSLSTEYYKKNNRVYGNLMRLKSDVYRHSIGNWWSEGENDWYIREYRTGDVYSSLEYFDKNATIADMDIMIDLLEKKNKSPFEEYLCAQPLGSVNAYKDLKGTLAFRNNDLQLAYTTFASMPQDYWNSNHLSFSTYLNEDPFVPKGLRANKYRRFDYHFNKADFVKELIDLEKQASSDKSKAVDCYIKLGNAYFNTSYWGNAWMMIRYGSDTGDLYYSRIDCLPQWMRDYMTAGIARNYYEKALKDAVNDEQRAYVLVMLSYIHRHCYEFLNAEKDKTLALEYGTRFSRYNQTKAFRMYECPGLRHFLSSIK